MTRNMDLVRELLLKIADDTRFDGIGNPTLDVMTYVTDAFDHAAIDYHVRLLISSGMIDGFPLSSPGFVVRRLTWDGHDLVDSIRDPKIWARTKGGAAAAGGFTVDLLKDLAKAFLRKQIEDRTGMKL